MFHYISRSLFKADRLTFGMHLVHGMYPKMFATNEWEAFLGILVEGDSSSSGSPGWVESERKAAVGRLRAALRPLYDAAQLDDGAQWQKFAAAEDCENEFPVQVGQSGPVVDEDDLGEEVGVGPGDHAVDRPQQGGPRLKVTY